MRPTGRDVKATDLRPLVLPHHLRIVGVGSLKPTPCDRQIHAQRVGLCRLPIDAIENGFRVPVGMQRAELGRVQEPATAACVQRDEVPPVRRAGSVTDPLRP